jgi:hypothetical protein
MLVVAGHTPFSNHLTYSADLTPAFVTYTYFSGFTPYTMAY